MSLIPIVRRIVSKTSLFRIVDASETKITSPRGPTMELTGVVRMSWIYLKWKQCKVIKGYSSKHGWMVEEDPRKISRWIFKWLYVGLDGLILSFETM